MTATEGAKHPALELGAVERDEYITLLGVMVLADAQEDERELATLGRLAAALEMPREATARALASARTLDGPRVQQLASKFKTHLLRQQLLTDAIVVAFADGRLDAAESEKIATLAAHVGLTGQQAGLIGRYVEKYLKAPDQSAALRTQLGDELASALGAADGKAPPAQTSGVFCWLLSKIGGK